MYIRNFGILDLRSFCVDLIEFLFRSKSCCQLIGKPSEHFHGPYGICAVLKKCTQGSERHLSAYTFKSAKQKSYYYQHLCHHLHDGIVLDPDLGLLHVKIVKLFVML